MSVPVELSFEWTHRDEHNGQFFKKTEMPALPPVGSMFHLRCDIQSQKVTGIHFDEERGAFSVCLGMLTTRIEKEEDIKGILLGDGWNFYPSGAY